MGVSQLNCIHRLILLISLGVGLGNLFILQWGPSFLREPLSAFDAAITQLAFPLKENQSIIASRPSITNSETSPPIRLITVTDDPYHIFETSPPNALDYAVIFEKLSHLDCKNLVITTRMTWDKPTSLPLPKNSPKIDLNALALGFKLSAIPRVCIGTPVTRGAVAQDLPPEVKRASIPLRNVKGNIHSLPLINRFPLPPDISGCSTLLTGFSNIENSPAPDRFIPMLAHWDTPKEQALIPSLALLTIMSALDISPNQIFVIANHSIQLGKNGPLIPIDEFGNTPLPPQDALVQTPLFSSLYQSDLPAESLISSQPSPSSSSLNKKTSSRSKSNLRAPLWIIRAQGERTSPTNLLPFNQLQSTLYFCKTLPQTPRTTIEPKTSFLFNLLLLALLLTAIHFILKLPHSSTNRAFAFTFLFLFFFEFLFISSSNQPFPLSAFILTLLSAWIATFFLFTTRLYLL